MKNLAQRVCSQAVILLCLLGTSAPIVSAMHNEILGEIQFNPAGKVEKNAGVWVDGLYLGYVGELKGSKKVLLVPGEHQIVIRYSGYLDFSTKVLMEPGITRDVRFQLEKDENIPRADATSGMKISVNPDRAAVFLNGGYVGHVSEFRGLGRWMLLPPGTYDVRIMLPGYLPFDTKITLVSRQRFELKTDLFPSSIQQSGPLVDQQVTNVSQNK
jgi:hypothetical protein